VDCQQSTHSSSIAILWKVAARSMLPFASAGRFMPVDPVLTEKAATIERCVARAREEMQAAADFAADFTRQDAAILNVERACEAAIGLAMRLVAQRGLGAPVARRDAFYLLSRAGLLPLDLATRLARMVGFRNIAVHAYKALDVALVQEIIASGLDDLLLFSSLMLREN
jgi:uncharacterized protein YutE (UPF0331/DUF86 family)